MTIIIRIIILTILSSLLFISCTDVIDIDAPEVNPRLVIEASIDWEKGTLGNNQTIKLSTSTPYFEEELIPVLGAQVIITNDSDGVEFNFEDQNNGHYSTNNFIPVLYQSYTLEVIYNGDTYTANETFTPVVDIENVYQSTDQGKNDVLEVNVEFQDPVDEENYYFFKTKEQADVLPRLFGINDEFVDGNLINIFFERIENENINQEEYQPGDIIDIKFYGISKQYFEYINLLIAQYDTANNPFGTIPVALKGNCVNQINPENHAFGYFRLTEVVISSYTFQ